MAVMFLRSRPIELFEDISAMKQSNIIFAGTVRNNETFLKDVLNHVDRCGQKFNDYAVVIYENDSKDKTRQILKEHKKDNYHYIFEDNVSAHQRTVRISNGRNKILDKARELNKEGYYHYLVMMDFDDINHSGRFVDTIESCFTYQNWDVLTANQSKWYYDLWALRKKGDMEYDCWQKARENSHEPDAENKYVHSKFRNYPIQEELLDVDSAFGGAAIYKISSIPEECRYEGSYSDGTERCEHVPFHECLKRNGKQIFINTKFLTS
jgi:glycosyltransferase involved in cell wall biosynthesis